ncbi:beta-ketoacyl synthase N-terminal-like domain-containing protein [Streptomyces toxytricini]|uniref:Beta-ketoacyl synthase N-terminal-like domain-containing protein n=1 Tax=Streptomyces toxytricini TaxID=67369 RepID=A0ABW8EEI3_STRT5
MDEREILTRFRDGTLDRGQAMALLAGVVPAAVPVAAGALAAPAAEGAPAVPAAGPSGPARATAAPTPAAPAVPSGGKAGAVAPVAVVGMALRQPQAPDTAAVWRQLRRGHCTASAPPSGRAATGTGHYLDAVQDFDAEFFGIDPAEAALTDPQERLFLETAWEALEDAGCTGSRLDALRADDGTPRSLGVYAGAGSGEYALLAAAAAVGEPGGSGPMPRSDTWSLASRVSALLRLTGPGLTLDTAESSVLVALHHALAALRRGECRAALVGGVRLLLHPSGRQPGAGEAVGAVVLKPLARALADGDTVHCLIRGSAFGHVPAGPDAAGRPAERLVRAALRESGPGTAAAPPVEDAASVAAAVGDAGAATGMAVLARAVFRLRHGTPLPRPGREPAEEPDPAATAGPRRAAVCVRGAGGVEAYAVLEEYAPERAAPPPQAAETVRARARERAGEPGGQEAELVLLSAPTPAHLAATAHRFAAFLTAPGPPPGLAALARSLRTGRAAMPCRYAALATDTDRLARRLAGLAPEDATDLRHGGADPLRLGAVPETRAYLAALWAGRRLDQLRDLWLAGVDVDWAALEQGRSGAGAVVVPLPPSAFLRSTHWLGGGPTR